MVEQLRMYGGKVEQKHYGWGLGSWHRSLWHNNKAQQRLAGAVGSVFWSTPQDWQASVVNDPHELLGLVGCCVWICGYEERRDGNSLLPHSQDESFRWCFQQPPSGKLTEYETGGGGGKFKCGFALILAPKSNVIGGHLFGANFVHIYQQEMRKDEARCSIVALMAVYRRARSPQPLGWWIKWGYVCSPNRIRLVSRKDSPEKCVKDWESVYRGVQPIRIIRSSWSEQHSKRGRKIQNMFLFSYEMRFILCGINIIDTI